MDLAEPALALVPGLTTALLRAVASRGSGATAEQIRRTAGVGTAAGVRRTLDRLAEHGLLRDTRLGSRSTVYELNRDHVLYPVVQAMLAVSDALPARLGAAISTWTPPPLCAALFGSAARRDGGLHSDIDLLIIHADPFQGDDTLHWDEQLHDLREQVRLWTGNHLQIVDKTSDELVDLHRARQAIIDDWRRDGVTVHGRNLQELLMEAR